MTQHTTHKNEAVSPVVGVMLLLIITVLITSLVSSYAGTLSETKEKAPTLIISPEIYRNDTLVWMNIPILSAGDGIHTRDLRIITEWVSLDATSSWINGGGTVTGGFDIYPKGHGVGVQDALDADDFGKYSLLGGTLMYIDTVDGCNALFGPDWDKLQEGDIVTLKIIHLPSRATIAEQKIMVREV
jgi:hypothetical protein